MIDEGECVWAWCLACYCCIFGQYVASKRHIKNAAWYGGGQVAVEEFEFEVRSDVQVEEFAS